MNLLELAQKRCSIRKYASSPVEDEKLAYILEAGRMAPSAVNFQPWYFVIIRQEAGRAKIQECYAREWVPIRTALHSRLRRPQPVVETFFGSERSYGHRCGNRHGTYQLSSR